MAAVNAAAGSHPHCPTCTCQRAKAREWRPYSPSTVGMERRCMGCGDTTLQPGPRRWHWRHGEPDPRFGRQVGRSTESLCPACAEKLLAIANQHAVTR